MAQIPKWLIGRGVSFSAVPCVLGATGTLTEQAGVNFSGRLDEVTNQSRNTLENISPMDSRQGNPVIVESQSSLNLTEILQDRNSVGDNALAAIGYNYDYVKFVFARASKTFVMYVLVEEYTENYRKGKSTGTLSVQSVSLSDGSGGYVANPTYS